MILMLTEPPVSVLRPGALRVYSLVLVLVVPVPTMTRDTTMSKWVWAFDTLETQGVEKPLLLAIFLFLRCVEDNGPRTSVMSTRGVAFEAGGTGPEPPTLLTPTSSAGAARPRARPTSCSRRTLRRGSP